MRATVSNCVIAALIVCLAAALLLPSCDKEEEPVTEQRQPAGSGERPGNVLEGVTLERVDGTIVPHTEYDDSMIVINFFATWHHQSKQLFPIMNEMQRKFGKHISIIGVAMDKEGAAPVTRFVEEQPIHFDIYIRGERVANRLGGVRNLPTTYFIFKGGRIFERIDGLRDKKYYEERFVFFITRRP